VLVELLRTLGIGCSLVHSTFIHYALVHRPLGGCCCLLFLGCYSSLALGSAYCGNRIFMELP